MNAIVKFLGISFPAIGALSMFSPVASAADSGPYVGAGLGYVVQTDYLPFSPPPLFDEKSTQWRVFGGYRVGLVPIFDFAAEVGYRDTGTASSTTVLPGSLVEYQTKGFDAAVLAIFPVLGADVFGKVGVMKYDLDKVRNGGKASFDGTAPLYGLGVGFRVLSFGVRIEYERVEVEQLKHLDGITVSGTYRF